MNKKMFAYVGNWNFKLVDGRYDRGISCYSYDPEGGNLELIDVFDREVAAGQMCLDNENARLYVAYEIGAKRGEIGGGGYLRSYSIDKETGALSLISEIDSRGANPSYVCLTKDKKHLLACHCADPHHANKIVKNEDGSFGVEVVMDDAPLILVEVKEDGSLGRVEDVFITGSNGKLKEDSRILTDPVTGHIQLTRVISRQHAVIKSPDGEIFAVMDKGMDRVYTFRLENGKIVQADCFQDEIGVFPRYGAFHPTLPVLYTNNERACVIDVFNYDRSGKLSLMERVPSLKEEYKAKEYGDGVRPMGAQDIAVHPDGKTLYCTVEGGDNLITVHRIKEDGTLELIQNIDCEGYMPRGICISPDARFLLCGNNAGGDITVFNIEEDGTLKFTGKIFDSISPSVIKIAEF
mgnify:CR=1 FL=1